MLGEMTRLTTFWGGVLDVLAYDSVQVHFSVVLDPLKFLLIGMKHWHPLDNPSMCYTLVLLAASVARCSTHVSVKVLAEQLNRLVFHHRRSPGCSVQFCGLCKWFCSSFRFPAIFWLQEDLNNQKPMLYCSTKMHSNLCNYLVITPYLILRPFLIVCADGQILIQ